MKRILLGLLLAAIFVSPVCGDTYVVTNTDSNPGTPGSLPWALERANTRLGFDTITFNIPQSGVQLIQMQGSVLWVNDPVHIDGNSQPGYTGQPLVLINGGGADSVIQINKGASTISGLQLYNFQNNAISIYGPAGSSGNVIRDNRIGFLWNGSTSLWDKNNATSYFATGVAVWRSSNNVLQNNVISGVHNGITIGEDPQAVGFYRGTPRYTNNTINGNFIGTTPDGLEVIGNNSDGIFLGAESGYNNIFDNLLSGNASAGVELLHPTVKRNIIYRNKIGTDITGDKVLGNGEVGVLVSNGATKNTIGGPWGGNTISGNAIAGVVIGTKKAFREGTYNRVENNLIGCNATATRGLKNQLIGVHIGTKKSRRNTVRRNTIGGNTWHGVLLENTSKNAIVANGVGTPKNGGSRLGNGRHGIYILKSHRNRIINNRVFYNGFGSPKPYWRGIEEQHSKQNRIRRNRVKRNKNNRV